MQNKINLNQFNENEQKIIQEFEQEIKKSPENQHIINVTNSLIEKKMPIDTIIAWLILKTQNENITKQNDQTKEIITECKQIQEILDYNYNKQTPETLTSLTLSLASTIQPIIIKMIETTDILKNENQKNQKKLIFIAKNIYSPLTLKLGISDINWKITDACFKIENRKEYEKIKQLINKTREEREQQINEIINEITKIIPKKINTQIFGRPKNFFSIHEKMKKTPFKKIYDIYGIRIICDKEKDCYEILGVIHEKYDFIKEAFDDYIAKEGKGLGKKGYQSIHTAINRNKDIIEIQIRTWQQHLRTESSIYWEYKRLKKNKEFDNQLSWERQLMEWQKSLGTNITQKKISGEKIFVFTPKNQIIILTENATALDFAFIVHTDIGKKAKQARINGTICALDTKLKNLDKIEIVTDSKNTIKQNWLTIVKTDKAKSKIRSYFKLAPKKVITKKNIIPEKKIQMAECCNPLPGEDVIGVKTTKRKIIIHKKECENIQKILKTKLIEISFEKTKKTTKLRILAIDRIGLLGEILEEFKKSKINLKNSDFKIKKTGFVEAIFEVEIKNIQTLDKIISKLKEIKSIQKIERS